MLPFSEIIIYFVGFTFILLSLISLFFAFRAIYRAVLIKVRNKEEILIDNNDIN